MPAASTSRSGTPDPQQHGDAQSRKRGRKQDDSLPPSRSRDIQRAFRARRAALLHNLEARVCFLERENYQLRLRCGLDPHGEPVSGPEPEYHRVDGIAEGIEGESKAGNGLGAARVAATADATAGTTGKRARKRQASSVASSEPSPNASAEQDGQRPGGNYPLAAAAGGAPSPLATLAHAAGTAASWQLQQTPSSAALGYNQLYHHHQAASPQQQQQLFAPLNGGGLPSPNPGSYGTVQPQQVPNNYPNGVGAHHHHQQQPNGVAVGFFHPHPPLTAANNSHNGGNTDSPMFAYHPPPPADPPQQQHAAYMYAAPHGGAPPPPPLASHHHHPNQQIAYAAPNNHYPQHHHQQQQPPTPISHTPSPASAATSPASNAGSGNGGQPHHPSASVALGLSSLQPAGGGAGGLGSINNNNSHAHNSDLRGGPSHYPQQQQHGHGDGRTTYPQTTSPAGGELAASPPTALAPPPPPPPPRPSSVQQFHHPHHNNHQQQRSPLPHQHHHLSFAGATSPATATAGTVPTATHSHSHANTNPNPPASVPASALDAPREYLLRACGLSPRTVSRALLAAGDGDGVGGGGQGDVEEEHRFAAFCAAVVEIAQRDTTTTGDDARGRSRPLMRIKLPRSDSNASSSSAVITTTTTNTAAATKVEKATGDKSQEEGQRQPNKSLEWNDELCCGGLIDCSAPLFDNTPSYPTPKGSGSGSGGGGGGGAEEEETVDSANLDNNDDEDQVVASSSTPSVPPFLPLRDAFSRLSRALRKAPIELAISLSTCSPPPGATSAFAMVSVPGNREDGVKGTEELWVAEKAVEDAIETGTKAAVLEAARKLPATCRPKSGCC